LEQYATNLLSFLRFVCCDVKVRRVIGDVLGLVGEGT
jgi:hypothetical protein